MYCRVHFAASASDATSISSPTRLESGHGAEHNGEGKLSKQKQQGRPPIA